MNFLLRSAPNNSKIPSGGGMCGAEEIKLVRNMPWKICQELFYSVPVVSIFDFHLLLSQVESLRSGWNVAREIQSSMINEIVLVRQCRWMSVRVRRLFEASPDDEESEQRRRPRYFVSNRKETVGLKKFICGYDGCVCRGWFLSAPLPNNYDDEMTYVSNHTRQQKSFHEHNSQLLNILLIYSSMSSSPSSILGAKKYLM